MSSKGLIFALDAESLNKALDWVERLWKYVDGFKIGSQFFTRVGLAAIKLIQEAQSKVFLDLKFHDIPFTVGEASYEAGRMGVWMFNVHCSGGREMLRWALAGAERGAKEVGLPRPKILGVTVLTSLDNQDLKELGFKGNVEEITICLARMALEEGLDGVVASPREVALLRQELGRDFLIVTPGIRLKPAENEDQKRIMTPAEAIRAGADYLIIGRPIRQAKDPVKITQQILDEIKSARS